MTEEEKASRRASNSALVEQLKADLSKIPITDLEIRRGRHFVKTFKGSIRSLIKKGARHE